MESVIHARGRLIVVGDFNMHVDVPEDATKFLNLIQSLGLRQHVTSATHNRGHTLDLIITRAADMSVSDIEHDWLLPSDHAALHFIFDFTRPSTSKITHCSRKFNVMNILDLQQRVASVHSSISYSKELHQYIHPFQRVTARVLI